MKPGQGRRAKRLSLAPALSLLALAGTAVLAEPPARWISRGPGGGGAYFGPSISPSNPQEMFVASDMSDTFHTRDGGWSWETLDFRQIAGHNKTSPLQFTSDPLTLYTLNDMTPMKSRDGGRTWQALSGDPTSGGSYVIYADGNRTNRVLVADYTALYFSSNGGATFPSQYDAGTDFHIAGVFFDGNRIFVGTWLGLLVSTNSGTSFQLSSITGIPGTESMVSFAGASQGGTTRLFCVTMGSGDVWPGLTGYERLNYKSIYRLDYGVSPSWTAVTNGIGGDYPFFVAMATNNIQEVYVAGQTEDGAPLVACSTNGGTSWQSVFLSGNNQNIYTGWTGDNPDPWNWMEWSFGEYALGFSVCPSDPARAVISDLGFVHVTTNSGLTWTAAYVHPSDLNPTNAPNDKRKSYHGMGLENTSCWHMRWVDSQTVYTAYTDIRGLLTTNAGSAWQFPTGLTYNSSYMAVVHPSNSTVYASASSVHDMYAWDNYLRDSKVDAASASGALLYSTNKGVVWKPLHDFGKPVVGICLDPTNANTLYACVVTTNPAVGGIHVTRNLNLGAGSTWSKLANPPRTQGHPYVVQALNDGTLVCSYSARLAGSSENFQPSSGVFVSTNAGAGWLDRTDANMQYYTKDIVIDPHDAAQQTWYAGVWGEWGNSSGKGGLYRTRNRGVTWTRITSGLQAVESCTISPANSNEVYVTTETQGLWYSTNLSVSVPTFTAVTNYPFRFPTRVFFNPRDTNEVWVCSYGNGMKLGRIREPAAEFRSLRLDAGGQARVDVAADSGQCIVLRTSTNLIQWQDLATNVPLDKGTFRLVDSTATNAPTRFYRAVAVP